MKGIYKQKGSQYYWLRFVGLDGRIIRKSSGTTKHKEALEKLEECRRAVREGKDLEPVKRIRNCTFNELKAEYLAWD